MFDAGAEYRFPEMRPVSLRPALGVMSADDGSLYVYTELKYDLLFGDRLVLTPSFGGGWFNNEGIDLGHDIEFRSGIELSCRLRNEHRVGVALHHLSNGGIAAKNPGTESLVLTLSIPLSP